MKALSTLMLALVSAWAAAAQGTVQIEINRPVDSRIPIAIPNAATPAGQEALGKEIADIITYDLTFTGLFDVLQPNEYPKSFTGLEQNVRAVKFRDWRGTRTENVVHIYVVEDSEKVVAECRLMDVFSEQRVIGRRITGHKKWPRPERLIAHQFSDEILKALTGVTGIATSEIVFSAGASGRKEIFIADYDGGYVHQATHHKSISIRPKLSPDGTKIAYLSYKDRFPFLYIFDRNTGRSTPLSKKVGLNASPAWSPDGTKLALVLSKDGNPEIYVINADGTGLRRLTRDRAIDASPTFHPTGKYIAFVRDAQILMMGADGQNRRRLSFQGGGRAYDPAWSPDGKSIAYVVEKSGEGLEIYVRDVTAANAQARRVTNSRGSNESPSWSPDSRHIVFASTRRGRSELWTVALETGDQRLVPGLNMRCEGPSWGRHAPTAP